MTDHPWKNFRRTLEDAYKPRPPIQYVVDKLFALPSLNIVYGPPGCLKSFLLADMVACVVSDRDWLIPAPWEIDKSDSFRVMQLPALWVDFDNGVNRTDNRFEALGRHYQIPEGLSHDYYSMPSPALDASKPGSIMQLVDLINDGGFKLVVIDNLATISGGRDENSSEMMAIMTNLRLVAERTGAAIVIVHHSRKENGFKGGKGDNLRGFSGIRGAIDTGLYVEREPNSEIVTIRAEKTRDVDIPTFAATFTYEHKPGCNDLETAAFYGLVAESGSSTKDIEQEIIDVLDKIKPNGALSQSKLAAQVKANLAGVGVHRIRSVINKLATDGKIKAVKAKNGNAHVYSSL